MQNCRINFPKQACVSLGSDVFCRDFVFENMKNNFREDNNSSQKILKEKPKYRMFNKRTIILFWL